MTAAAATARAFQLQRPNFTGQYIAAGDSHTRSYRRRVTEVFTRLFAYLERWMAAPAADRLVAPLPQVVAARSRWGPFIAKKHPSTAATSRAEATGLGLNALDRG